VAPTRVPPYTGGGGEARPPRAGAWPKPGRVMTEARQAGKSFGTVSPERQRELSGLEFVRGLVSGALPLNTMARALGYDIVEAEEGRVVIQAVPSREHLNPNGTVHGGVAATLLDSCMGLAIRTRLPSGTGSTTLEFKISFLRPILPELEWIRAEGKVLTSGRRVGTAEGWLTGPDGRVLVHGTTTCLNYEDLTG